jgi:hypothetical protein
MRPTAELFLAQAEQLVNDVRPLFAGKPPAVLVMALAELVARHFASMRRELRNNACDEFLRIVLEMIPDCERQIFLDGPLREWRQ